MIAIIVDDSGAVVLGFVVLAFALLVRMIQFILEFRLEKRTMVAAVGA